MLLSTAYFGAVLIFSSIDTVDGGNYSDIARKIDQYNTFTNPPPIYCTLLGGVPLETRHSTKVTIFDDHLPPPLYRNV